MPGVSGISVGKVLMQQNPNLIIFIVTSFSAYLDDAMRFHVFRYLSKPIEKQRLFRNMKDALVLYNSVSVSVPIETKQGVTMVLTSDIIMVEAKDRKVYLYTPQTSYECIQKMDYWTKALPKSSFFASHRSYIVNMKYVTDFDHSLIYLFHRKYTAYLTRRQYTSFKEAFLLYAGSMQ